MRDRPEPMSLEAPRAMREVKRWWMSSVVVRSLRDPRGVLVSRLSTVSRIPEKPCARP